MFGLGFWVLGVFLAWGRNPRAVRIIEGRK